MWQDYCFTPLMRPSLRLAVLLSLSSAVSVYACGNDRASGPGPGSTEGPKEIELTCGEFADAAGWSPGEAVSATAAAQSGRIDAAGEKTWLLALDLLAAVPASEVDNLAQSPTSFYAAMGMAYSRWQEEQCGESIANVLHFPEKGDAIHQTIGAGLRSLSQRALPEAQEQPPVVLNLSASRWAFGASRAPEPQEIERIYGATPHAVMDQGEASRTLINCVIEQQSSGLLKEFIPKGVIDVDTRALDINVTYLKAPWTQAFEKTEVDFRSESGAERRVPGLSSSALSASFFEAPSFNSIHLPLRGGMLRVLVVVPNDTVSSSLEAFAKSLSESDLRAARDTKDSGFFEFSMPQVNIESTSLDYSKRLGFDCDPFTLGNLIHGAAVVMDEGGIEAVAATVAEEWGDGASEPETRPFSVERPFLFFVYDAETRFVLFSGRVLELG